MKQINKPKAFEFQTERHDFGNDYLFYMFDQGLVGELFGSIVQSVQHLVKEKQLLTKELQNMEEITTSSHLFQRLVGYVGFSQIRNYELYY